jgi:hypothetical protein
VTTTALSALSRAVWRYCALVSDRARYAAGSPPGMSRGETLGLHGPGTAASNPDPIVHTERSPGRIHEA